MTYSAADFEPDEELDRLEAVQRLSKDMIKAGATLGPREARFLVDSYYAIQHYRVQSGNQIKAMDKSAEPHDLLTWQTGQMAVLEAEIKKALGRFALAHLPGRWAMSIAGIGPVLAAGFLAHIDIERAPTVGHVWSFAGLNPTQKWEKGKTRPWNAKFKLVCWKAGESFVKVQNNERDHYGKVYATRKAQEIAKNEAGEFRDQAQASLDTKKWKEDTDAFKYYSQGLLPPARIHLRATRYATKLFLSHLHHVMYEHRFGTPPPKPYIIEHGGHVHFLAPPNWPMEG